MKLKKLLLVSLLSGIAVLTACDKKQTNTNSAEQRQNAETNQGNEALNQFNNSVQIQISPRQFSKDVQNNDVIVYSYNIKNISGKPIKSLSWSNIYAANNQTIYAAPGLFHANFNQEFVPNADITLNLQLSVANLPEQIRPLFLDKNLAVNALVSSPTIEFTDGSQIIVK